jgi:phosphoribosylformylglycinamidine cyclo-ligase
LVRRIIDAGVNAGDLDLRAEHPELDTSLAGALLAPTRIYVKPILNVLRDFTVKGIVHVTGGGLPGNVPRVLPKSVRARIDPGSWPRPPIFPFLQRRGELTESEMLRVFNCGLGMLLIVAPEEADDITQRLQGTGERAYRIGEIEAKAPDESSLLISEQRADTG